MTFTSIPGGLGIGAGNLPSLSGLFKELQGLNISLLTGAAANTKINVSALRSEDTILAAWSNTSGTLADETANTSIVDTHASGTLTVASVVADDSCVVAGITYSFKASPTAGYHVQLTSGNNTANAGALANAINLMESRKVAGRAVVANAASGVVTIKAIADGATGNSIVLTGTPTRLAASGSGTLAGGTATGGILCTSNLTGKQVLLFWVNKQ